MEDKLFEELMQSVREAGAILRGETEPSRVTTLSTPDVKSLRQSLGLSQKEFSAALHVSDGTLRNWEQNRRQPTGPARALLTLVEKQPAVLKILVPARASDIASASKNSKKIARATAGKRAAKSSQLAKV